MIEDLRAFVESETPYTEKKLLGDFAGFLAGYATESGGEVEVLPDTVSGDHVRALWDAENEEAPLLLLGHYDTVSSAGTLGTMPFETKDGIATEPGEVAMKCGLVQSFWAVKSAREVLGVHKPIVLLCNSGEEIGSPGSRTLIEAEARRAAAVLVLERSLGGALKTARKGAGRYLIRVTGKPAHAGLDPKGGVSAIEVLSRLVLGLHDHSDPEGTGTTVNVGVVEGGTRYNVIAAEGSAEVDVRAVVRTEAERVRGVFSDLQPSNPGARIEVEVGEIWPPMERTEEIGLLYDHARELAADLGFDLTEKLAGGASDGCLCAAVGAPVLDGLGAVGAGAHAAHEHVELESVPLRTALVARVLETL